MNNEVKHRILAIFEKHRKSPGVEFDENHFIDYLLPQPKNKGAFRNSFSGLRRFNAFWDEIQLEFKVCFSLSDRDKNFSLDRFTTRVIELTLSKKSSVAALRRQMKFGFEWNIFIFGNLLLFIPVPFLNKLTYLLYAYVAFIVFVNIMLINRYLKDKKYLQKLFDAINES